MQSNAALHFCFYSGWVQQAAKTLTELVNLFPSDVALQNELAANYLSTGAYNEAREIFKKVASHYTVLM